MKTNKQEVLCGADVVAQEEYVFTGKCGLITNQTGVLKDLSPTIDMLKEKCNLVALFSPEHGVRGDKQAAEDVTTFIDERTKLPVYSLYGSGLDDGEKALSTLDTVIFDIQDVGARFYTYAYTMTDAMKICAENKVKFIVLDRPNLLGGKTAEGTILEREFSSFVGRFPTPTRSGLTIGEFALMMNETEKIGCDLSVVALKNWKRELYYDETDLVFISPSPNIPTVDTAFAYIGTCIFEGTNLSEGRGTTKPFEMIGAPWLNPEKIINQVGKQSGVILRECSFTPTFSKFKNEFCKGIQLHITDRNCFNPFEVGIRIFKAIRDTHKEFIPNDFTVRLVGKKEILNPDLDIDEFISNQKEEVVNWQNLSKKWYLYQ